jgi:hypothetical protein
LKTFEEVTQLEKPLQEKFWKHLEDFVKEEFKNRPV